MRYFANPCGSGAVLDAMRSGTLGYIDTPLQGNVRPRGLIWCADNGCFSDRWNERDWWAFLVANAHDTATCAFAVAPDVVGDAVATLALSARWFGMIRALGYPVAFVAQDGQEDLPLPAPDLYDVLFVGGSTAWKLGPGAREVAHAAKEAGKRVHVGRVNSARRWRLAAAPFPYGLGADTCDGTFLTYGPDRNLPELLGWDRHNEQEALI